MHFHRAPSGDRNREVAGMVVTPVPNRKTLSRSPGIARSTQAGGHKLNLLGNLKNCTSKMEVWFLSQRANTHAEASERICLLRIEDSRRNVVAERHGSTRAAWLVLPLKITGLRAYRFIFRSCPSPAYKSGSVATGGICHDRWPFASPSITLDASGTCAACGGPSEGFVYQMDGL